MRQDVLVSSTYPRL